MDLRNSLILRLAVACPCGTALPIRIRQLTIELDLSNFITNPLSGELRFLAGTTQYSCFFLSLNDCQCCIATDTLPRTASVDNSTAAFTPGFGKEDISLLVVPTEILEVNSVHSCRPRSRKDNCYGEIVSVASATGRPPGERGGSAHLPRSECVADTQLNF